MSGLSFGNVQEEKAKQGVKATTGIHEFKVVDVFTEEVKGKDGAANWKKGVVVLECTKSIVAKDLEYSVGKTINYDILYPKDQESAEKTGKRLIHMFSKISTKDKIETVKLVIQKLDLTSIDTLMEGLSKIIKGRSLRLKVVCTQDGKYPQIPLYYAGYAETIDTVPSELKYDESKEGTVTQPKNAEKATNSFEPIAEEGLPF